MSDTLSFAEIRGQHVELLPVRTVLSLFTAADVAAADVASAAPCTSHDGNIDVPGEAPITNGLGNVFNGEGNPGAQSTKLGSTLDCANEAF